MELSVQIVRFVSREPQPGVVACEFVDADNRTHTIVDKLAIFTAVDLDDLGPYPTNGVVRCEVLGTWKNPEGRELVRITTRRDGVESTEGLSEFVVLRKQLLEA